MSIKIIHLITSLEGGGTENFLYQVLAHSPSGYDHQVIYLKKDGVIGERIRRNQITVRPAGSLISLYRTLKKEKPALLHTCLYSAHVVGRCLGRLAHGPAIITSQRSIDIWQKPWQTRVDRWTLPWSDAVIVNSHAAAQVIAGRRGQRPNPEIIEIPNGVDSARFQAATKTATRERYSLPANAIVGGALMRLHTEKGADFIPRFAEGLLPAHPNLHLLVGGVGSLEGEIKSRLAGTAYGDRVHWIGWENDAPGFLSACDFFWSLSREESFPQTLVEASAMGLPWVAPEIGGVPELIQAGAIGRVFPRLDIAGAVSHVSKLLKDLPAQTQAASRAALTIQMRYSVQKMINQVYGVFARFQRAPKVPSTP